MCPLPQVTDFGAVFPNSGPKFLEDRVDAISLRRGERCMRVLQRRADCDGSLHASIRRSRLAQSDFHGRQDWAESARGQRQRLGNQNTLLSAGTLLCLRSARKIHEHDSFEMLLDTVSTILTALDSQHCEDLASISRCLLNLQRTGEAHSRWSPVEVSIVVGFNGFNWIRVSFI